MKTKNKWLLAFLFLTALFLALVFNNRPMYVQSTTLPSLSQVPDAAWTKLAQKRILFGHASVGSNIIDGIRDVQQKQSKVQLNIVENDKPWTVQNSGLIHFKILQHEVPAAEILDTKIDAFQQFVETSGKQGADIAFFELCWADVKPDTDVARVFSHYKSVMAKLVKEFPNTAFIPMTIPLVAEPSGLDAFKNQVKLLLGKSLFYLSDNIKIKQFNDLLNSEYAGKMPVFDLAKVESTTADGKQERLSRNGQEYYALVKKYTDDGGHLNNTGRKVVAEQLLILLAQNQ
jgi:hypothetical protein